MGQSLFRISFVFLFMSLFYHLSRCQQEYINNMQLNCDSNSSITKGYVCDSTQRSCQSLITFRSLPPYDSPVSIANLLSSEASDIASINDVSLAGKFPPDQLIIVPISCSCWGNRYQHNAPYTVKASDTYFTIANNTYQGMTTCQGMLGLNSYLSALIQYLEVGSQVLVPMRCACPSRNQTNSGVNFLLVYMITWGDTLEAVGEHFGVSVQSIREANMLQEDDLIFPFTPILVPMKNESCSTSSSSFFCKPRGKGFPVKLVTILGIGIGVGFLCLFFASYQLYQCLKRRRHIIHKERLFKQNGGYLLQRRLSCYGSSDKTKIFTEQELERATDNYNQSRFLGQGGYGTVYKGMLPDGTIVAVKRSKEIDVNRTEQFINEVVILSQINHRNVVKLLGCCLETELPLLVYEFISNGSLFDHIHGQQDDLQSWLSWDTRFRIAIEVAEAVAYMHSAASIPIFHRDIKSSNILLDDKYTAKVSDFGTSRSVPYDKTHLTTAVQGTFGYLDPEYFQSSQFTDKSDVYSFGVLLVELLTGEKPISFARAEEERNLVVYFISSIKEDQLLRILDPQIIGEAAGKEEVIDVAKLANRCLKSNGKKRPTMKEVAMELERLRKSPICLQQSHVWRDQVSFTDIVAETSEESVEGSTVFSVEMESMSV